VTDPRDYAPDDPILPGLEPPRAGAGANELAARRTLAALVEIGTVGEREAVIMEALLTAARAIDRATASGRAKEYGVAELLAQVRELFRVLVPEDAEGGDTNDEWSQLVARLRRGGTAPRDPAEPRAGD
jgi:hypothetical protein